MNVLYLTMNPNRASTTVPTEGWFRHLRSQGLRPVLVSHELGGFHEWAVEQGIPAFHVSLPFPNKWNPAPLLSSLWKLRRLVRKYKIQLIHCNEQNIYPIGQYLARWCRLPVVVSIHFTMERPFCTWAFGGRRQPDRIFFISPGNLEACREGVEGVIDPDRWRMLFNGLELDHFRPDPVRRERFRSANGLENAKVIGTACALRARKQLEHLGEVVPRLGEANVRVVVAGGPVPDERDYARDLLNTLRKNLGDRLVYLGHLNELRDLYNGLDVFVNTSQEEACSISVLEAMACGCPVVGYPSKSVDGQVLPGGGEIVPQDDVTSLVGTLNRWLGDPQRLEAGRTGARRRVEQEFDISRISRQLWEEYRALVAEGIGSEVRQP